MGAAYYIVLDNKDPGFDPFVNGKFVAAEARKLSKVCKALGVKALDDYVSMDPEDVADLADLGEEVDLPDDSELPAEQWFDPDEGLTWIQKLRAHIQAKPGAVKNAAGVLADLAEYARVLAQAKGIGAKWHLMVDF